MIIGFDGRTLQDRYWSGVSQFSGQLLDGLLALDRDNEYRLFFSGWRAQAPAEYSGRVRSKCLRWPNKIVNYAALRPFGRPRLDRYLGADIFYQPHLNYTGLARPERSLLTLHDLSFLRRPDLFPWRKELWHRALSVRRLVRDFGSVIAVSDHTRRDAIDLLGLDPDRVRTIHSGVDERFFTVPEAAQLLAAKRRYRLPDRYVLYLGTIEPRKNIAGLIRAFSAVVSRDPDRREHLVLAGAWGWLNGPVKAALNASACRDRIHVLGYIDEADKPAIYRLADVFAYPSLYEGFGFPLLEAMASGRPVITGAFTSLPELVGPAGVLIDPEDETALADALAALLGNEAERSRRGGLGQERAHRFSWQNAVARYSAAFQAMGGA